MQPACEMIRQARVSQLLGTVYAARSCCLQHRCAAALARILQGSLLCFLLRATCTQCSTSITEGPGRKLLQDYPAYDASVSSDVPGSSLLTSPFVRATGSRQQWGWLDSTLAAPRQNVVNFSSSVILYVQPPPPLGSKPEIPYSVYSFSGASCAGFTLTSAGCGRDPPFGWITDEAVFRQDGILATGVNGSGSTGYVMQQAVCDNGAPNCLAFRVPLSPSITYSFLITNPNGDMTCHADYTFLSYVQGAPECSRLPEPYIFPLARNSSGEGLDHIPGSTVPGLVAIRPFTMAGTAPLRINESIAAAGAFDNAACARFAIWAPSQAAELDLSAFALAVVPARELVGLLQGAGTLSQESFGRYLVCQGGDCAAEGEWASVTNLDPALQYYTVAHLDGWVNESSAQTGAQTIYYMQQPLGIDACATQLPDRPGVEASHQGSNVGALAGAAAAAVIGIALIAVAAWLIIRRRRRQMLADLQADMHKMTPDEENIFSRIASYMGAEQNDKNDQDHEPIRQAMEGTGVAEARPIDWQIFPHQLSISKTKDGKLAKLGSGAFGDVYRGRLHKDDVAVKVFSADTRQLADPYSKAVREIALLQGCRHRNVVQAYGVCIWQGFLMMVTEIMDNGDLYNAIQNDTDGQLVWRARSSNQSGVMMLRGRSVAIDICRGLEYLHAREILHFDVKSKNCLLSSNWVAKLADVGLSSTLAGHTHVKVTGCRGTKDWAAPEALIGGNCTAAADMYSMGIVLWEICSHDIPDRGQNRTLKVPQECPQAVADAVCQCTQLEPSLRPTARELLQVFIQDDG